MLPRDYVTGYLCAAKDGLTEAEMEDLLSLDDEVNYLYYSWTAKMLKMILIQCIKDCIKIYILRYEVEMKC
jgi:hypothetical protein